MRAFSLGQHFMHTQAEGSEHPVFSEAFLYDIMFKEDARFVLAVAEEYSVLIEVLGEEKIKEILKDNEDATLLVRMRINELIEEQCPKKKNSPTTASNVRKRRSGSSKESRTKKSKTR